MKKRGLKFKIFSTIIGCTLGSLVGLGLHKHDSNLVALPSVVAESIGEKIETDSDQDINITTDYVKSLESIDLELMGIEDISFLKEFTGLKRVNLFRPSLLAEEEIDFINSLDLEEVVFKIDFIEPDVLCRTDIDYKKLNNIKFDFSKYDSEEAKVLLFDRYSDIMEKSLSKEEFDKISKMNSWVDDTLKEINVLPTDSEKDKVYKIVKYICQKFEYDKDALDDKALSNYYNEYIVSSIMSQPDSKKGVCINYASLFTLLCTKCNLNCVTDYGDFSGGCHAWNKFVLENGDIKYTDITNFDQVEDYTYFLNYIDDEDEVIREIAKKALDDFFWYTKEQFDRYYTYTKDNLLYEKIRYTKKYYNIHHKVPYIPLFGLAGGAAGFGVALLNLSKKENDKKKKKILNK